MIMTQMYALPHAIFVSILGQYQQKLFTCLPQSKPGYWAPIINAIFVIYVHTWFTIVLDDHDVQFGITCIIYTCGFSH